MVHSEKHVNNNFIRKKKTFPQTATVEWNEKQVGIEMLSEMGGINRIKSSYVHDRPIFPLHFLAFLSGHVVEMYNRLYEDWDEQRVTRNTNEFQQWTREEKTTRNLHGNKSHQSKFTESKQRYATLPVESNIWKQEHAFFPLIHFSPWTHPSYCVKKKVFLNFLHSITRYIYACEVRHLSNQIFNLSSFRN